MRVAYAAASAAASDAPVGRQGLRPCQSGLDPGAIAQTIKPAMLGDLPVVNREGDLRGNPPPRGHLASARRISRSSCMIASAAAIWRWKSGL